jgi:hypothetical protein
MHLTWHQGVTAAKYAVDEAGAWLVDEMIAAGAHHTLITPAGMFGDARFVAEGPDYAGLYVTIHPQDDTVDLLRQLLGTRRLVAVLELCIVEVAENRSAITVSVAIPDRKVA